MCSTQERPLLRPNSRPLLNNIFSLLQSCISLKTLSQIHAQILLNGFSQKNFLLSKLLAFLVASGDLLHARQVFQQIEKPNTVIYNHLIRAFSRTPTSDNSLLLYKQMRLTETEPDSFTYSFLLAACATPSLLREGEQLHGIIVSNGHSSSIFVQTNLVNMYAATVGDVPMEKARLVFEDMPHRNVVSWNSMLAGYLRSGDMGAASTMFDNMPQRNVVSWTTMIAGCSQSGRCKQALSLFREMRRANVEADQVTMVAVLSACAELGDLKLGRWIHACIEGKREVQQPERRLVSLNNALMHMYAKCGVVDEAYGIFEDMRQRSVISWTTMITGFAMHGCAEDAVNLFERMQHAGVNPDEVTFLGVLCACCHIGWVDKGRQCFEHMVQVCGIMPRIEHYGCMVDLLSRAGQLDEAQQLIKTMPMEPNDVVWGALLGGCRIHKDVELASLVAKELKLMELEPDRAAGYLVLLSNVYAMAKKWDEVERVRKVMVQLGVRKPTGRSWIQVNDNMHEFVAGDRTHCQTASIYEMVEEITRLAKSAGYVPDESQVLLDVEEEEKEGFLYLHSEKLAVAFGLISIPDPRLTIRIVKNLRICSDCHAIAKFVSKIFSREISIRDRNRFHHFRGGICSCKDYW